jgi:hypothetical protein
MTTDEQQARIRAELQRLDEEARYLSSPQVIVDMLLAILVGVALALGMVAAVWYLMG